MILINTAELNEDTEMALQGDNVSFGSELIAPIAMKNGLRFVIRKGDRNVDAGVVSKITD